MLTLIKPDLKIDYPSLAEAMEQSAEIIEIELADRTLKQGLFVQYASSRLARMVASEMISLLRLSLIIGDLSPFYNTVEWESQAVLKNQEFFKHENDLAFIGLVRDIMLERLDSSLTGSIQGLYNQARTIFDYCWRESRVKEILAN
jgi:hypothetical protein